MVANIVGRFAEACAEQKKKTNVVRQNNGGNIGFVDCVMRTNVALTRAKHCMWILGHEFNMV